ncbi:serine protease [Stenotrophomonas sp. C3(2023)]|uniref:S1 family peptidase n=1 Tax=Stenotrophomonas sp. C3(2023) TaxID=3080277 RepID=UPI00293C66F6|nr:serine protease [Stenotrophomonas sp. C3(2023)]MDV3468308.1 serine protease [Stenotrophomonas sp. C3(2023)]
MRLRHLTAFLFALPCLLLPLLGDAATPSPRIIGGEDAPEGRYPFMVSLQVPEIDGPTPRDKHYCGGTLIAPSWVLLANHCFVTNAKRWTIRLGSTDLNDPNARELEIASIHRPGPFDFDRDIALVRLATPVSDVTPVRLIGVAGSGYEAPGYPMMAVGWGASGADQVPERLQHVQVPFIALAQCQAMWGDSALHPENAMCAGTPTRGACGGDSGGPLLVNDGQGWIQLGIVSRGPRGCVNRPKPSVFMRLAGPEIHGFIQQTLADNP